MRVQSQVTRRAFLGRAAEAAAGLAALAIVRPADAASAAMSHRQRIENALAGKETDRIPFGFWWHFPNQDRAPRRLAHLSLALQQQLDLDFIKFSPYGLYSVVDWGVVLDVRGDGEPPVQAKYPIQQPDDWRKLRSFRGTEGEYLIVLEAQRITLEEMKHRVPLVQTVFNPLTSALKMTGRETLLRHLREAPRALHAGLEVIADTTRRFAAETVARGADGLFFATQTANQGYLTPAEYRDFARPYDLQVLSAVRDRSWFNILHLHGANPMFDQALDYPVQAINYHDREGAPSLAEARRKTPKCLVGGLGHTTTLVHGTPEDVDAQVRDAWKQVERRGLILAPGCVGSPQTPQRNLLQLRESVARTARL